MATTCQCPTCKKFLTAPDEVIGQQAQCPSCLTIFTARAGSQLGPVSAWQESAPSPPPRWRPRDGEPRRRARSAADARDAADARLPSPAATDQPLPSGKASLAAACLVLMMISQLGHLLATLARLQSLPTHYQVFADHRFGPMMYERQYDIEVLSGLAGCGHVLVSFAAFVAFLNWFAQAYRNLLDMRVQGLEHSPAWAIGWFFIPFMNLFMPFRVAQEIWRASNPHTPPQRPRGWRSSPGSVLAGVWWVCLLVSAVLFGLALLVGQERYAPLEETRFSLTLMVLGHVAALLSLLSAFLLVRNTQRRQAVKWQRLAEG